MGEMSSKDISDSHADFDWSTGFVAGDAHEACLGFEHDGVPWRLGVRARGAVACMKRKRAS